MNHKNTGCLLLEKKLLSGGFRKVRKTSLYRADQQKVSEDISRLLNQYNIPHNIRDRKITVDVNDFSIDQLIPKSCNNLLGPLANKDINLYDNAKFILDLIAKFFDIEMFRSKTPSFILELGSGNGRLCDLLHVVLPQLKKYIIMSDRTLNFDQLRERFEESYILQGSAQDVLKYKEVDNSLPLKQCRAVLSMNFGDLFSYNFSSTLSGIHDFLPLNDTYLNVQEYEYNNQTLKYLVAKNSEFIPCILNSTSKINFIKITCFSAPDIISIIKNLCNLHQPCNEDSQIRALLEEWKRPLVVTDDFVNSLISAYKKAFVKHAYEIRDPQQPVSESSIDKCAKIVSGLANSSEAMTGLSLEDAFIEYIKQGIVEPAHTDIVTGKKNPILSVDQLAAVDYKANSDLCKFDGGKPPTPPQNRNQFFEVLCNSMIIRKGAIGFISDLMGRWIPDDSGDAKIIKGVLALKKIELALEPSKEKPISARDISKICGTLNPDYIGNAGNSPNAEFKPNSN